MSVDKDPSGRRSVAIEIDMPGTPEQVWQAIASGPGISAWFVPTRFEEQDGIPVAITSSFGPGIASRSAITAWDPPRHYAKEGKGWGGMPPVATEWTVEAQAGGLCRIRVVHSLFASTDEWDDQLEGTASGWPGFFRTLRIYLGHFAGQPAELRQFVAPVPGSEADAWHTLLAALGLTGARVGQTCSAAPGVPAFSGVMEYYTDAPCDALMRIALPGPGVLALGAFDMGGQSMVALNLYLYGTQASDTAAQVAPVWQQWFEARFPAPARPD